MIGAGLLSLPWTMEQASLVGGVGALVFMAIFNSVSLYFLAKCCELTGAYSYKGIGEVCFGRRAGLFIQAIVGLYTLGSCVTYAVLAGMFVSYVFVAMSVLTTLAVGP